MKVQRKPSPNTKVRQISMECFHFSEQRFPRQRQRFSKVFTATAIFACCALNVILLKCVSMNNQQCRIRREQCINAKCHQL